MLHKHCFTKIVLVFVIILYSGLAIGQKKNAHPKQRTLRLDAGATNYFLNDQLQSALNHSGIGVKLQLQYDALTNKKFETIHLNYSYVTLKDKIKLFPLTGNAANLKYIYREKSDKLSFMKSQAYIGGGVNAGMFLRNSESVYSGEFFGNLSINYLLRKNIKDKHIIQAEIDFALLSYLAYMFNAFESTDQLLQFPDKVLNYNFSLDYELVSSRRFSFVARYHFNYFSHNRPVIGVKYGTNSLFVGAKLKLYKP